MVNTIFLLEGSMRFLSLITIMAVAICASSAQAQYSSTKNAQYLATIKAVANYKINDEEEYKNVERLRQDARFNEKLQGMLNKLQNTKTKNSDNKRVLKILEDAGKEIYDILK